MELLKSTSKHVEDRQEGRLENQARSRDGKKKKKPGKAEQAHGNPWPGTTI